MTLDNHQARLQTGGTAGDRDFKPIVTFYTNASYQNSIETSSNVLDNRTIGSKVL